MTDEEKLKEIRERQKWRANAQRQNGRTLRAIKAMQMLTSFSHSLKAKKRADSG